MPFNNNSYNILTPTNNADGSFYPNMNCNWTIHNPSNIVSITLFKSLDSSDDLIVTNCIGKDLLLNDSLTATYTQEPKICISFWSGSNNTLSKFWRLVFQAQNEINFHVSFERSCTG